MHGRGALHAIRCRTARIDPRLPLVRITYAIQVYSGEVANAGTDANVFITLHGRWGIDLPERKLDNPGMNDFERDSKSSFILTGPLIGGVNSIRIRHDNTGNAPGWYLDQVAVRRVGALINFFPCYRWLAWDEADCAIDLIIGSFPEPIPTPGVPIKCKPQAEPQPPAPEVQGTIGSVLIFNCVPEHRPIHIWTFDLLAPSVWKDEGKLDHHYDASGYCPVGQPLTVEFESDHAYGACIAGRAGTGYLPVRRGGAGCLVMLAKTREQESG